MNDKSHGGLVRLCMGLLLAGAIASAAPTAWAQDEYKSLGATLFGENEIGHEGAGDDAGGDFDGEIDMEQGTLCYYLEVYGLDEVTASHLYKGGKGVNGEPVLALEVLGEDGDEVCAQVEPELLRDIMRNEFNYYVNVHTAALPAGAIRGQLGS